MHRWRKGEGTPPEAFPASWSSHSGKVMVVRGDWGDATLFLSKTYGETFVVLNMAHAKSPGGRGRLCPWDGSSGGKYVSTHGLSL